MTDENFSRGNLEKVGIEFIPSGLKQVKNTKKQDDCFSKIMTLSEETGKLCREGRQFSEDNLYDENGLPA